MIGAYHSYKTLQWLCLLVPITFLALFYFIPESPYYLLSKGLKDNAISALGFFRQQNSNELNTELCQIQNTVEEMQSQRASFKDVFRNGGNRRAIIIAITLMSIQQMSGINVVLFYCQTIFTLTNIDIHPSMASAIMSLFQLLAALCPPLLVDRVGRKIILLISSGFMSISLIGLGTLLYEIQSDSIELNELVKDNSTSGFMLYMPIILLIVYIFTYTIGFGPLPWLVMSEIFPANVKCYAASIVTASCWILGFACTYTFPFIEHLGIYYAFWLYGCYCIFGFYFTLRHLLETKGLTFLQIQDALNSNKK